MYTFLCRQNRLIKFYLILKGIISELFKWITFQNYSPRFRKILIISTANDFHCGFLKNLMINQIYYNKKIMLDTEKPRNQKLKGEHLRALKLIKVNKNIYSRFLISEFPSCVSWCAYGIILIIQAWRLSLRNIISVLKGVQYEQHGWKGMRYRLSVMGWISHGNKKCSLQNIVNDILIALHGDRW